MYHSTYALVDRCLRVDNRALYVHGFRFAFLMFVYLILLIVSLQSGFVDAAGLGMFSSLIYLNLFFILAANLGLFCGAITEEKEEMTLGLLKMAGIHPVALLLGKCLPRLVTATTLLLAELPFVMLCITLGGVSVMQIIASFACLLSFLLLNAGIGVFCSVVAPRTAMAAVLAIVILLAYFFGPILFGGSMEVLVNCGLLDDDGIIMAAVNSSCTLLLQSNAFVRISEILFTGGDRTIFNVQTITNAIGGIVLVGLAWMAFDKCTRSDVAVAPARLVGKPTPPLANGRRRFRTRGPGRVWEAALVWKDFHFTAGGRFAVLGLTSLYLGGAVAAGGASSYFGWSGPGFGPISWETVAGTLMTLTCLVGTLQASFLAARIFADEVHQQTLSSLVVLPQSIGIVLWSKIAGAAITVLPAIVLFLMGGASMALFHSFSNSEGALWSAFVGTVAYAVRFVGFLHVTVWLSLYFRWGALPLGFIAYIMTSVMEQMLFGLFFFAWIGNGLGGDVAVYAQWLISVVVWIVGTLILQRLIVSKVRLLAARS